MKYNIYAVWDAVAEGSMTTFASKTDGMAVRENMPTLARMRPLKDLTLYKIAEYDDETLIVTPCEKKAVSWEAYKFPEGKSEIKTITEKNEEKAQTKKED